MLRHQISERQRRALSMPLGLLLHPKTLKNLSYILSRIKISSSETRISINNTDDDNNERLPLLENEKITRSSRNFFTYYQEAPTSIELRNIQGQISGFNATRSEINNRLRQHEQMDIDNSVM